MDYPALAAELLDNISEASKICICDNELVPLGE